MFLQSLGPGTARNDSLADRRERDGEYNVKGVNGTRKKQKREKNGGGGERENENKERKKKK